MKTCNSHKCSSSKKRFDASWVPAIVVAILPKCPFCIMAYSGAISMCSGRDLYPNLGNFSSYALIFLASLVLLGIALNRKGRRTWIALAIAALGIAFITIGQFYLVSALNYYIGVVLLFFGIWYNGSFLYFYNKYQTKIACLITSSARNRLSN